MFCGFSGLVHFSVFVLFSALAGKCVFTILVGKYIFTVLAEKCGFTGLAEEYAFIEMCVLCFFA